MNMKTINKKKRNDNKVYIKEEDKEISTKNRKRIKEDKEISTKNRKRIKEENEKYIEDIKKQKFEIDYENFSKETPSIVIQSMYFILNNFK